MIGNEKNKKVFKRFGKWMKYQTNILWYSNEMPTHRDSEEREELNSILYINSEFLALFFMGF